MGVLNILDVNSFLHTSHHVSELNKKSSRNCPVGGLQFISRKISYLLSRNEDVVCAFDSKTNRKLLFPNYKNGRVKVPKVVLQSEALYKFLTNAGICCIKTKGLEADDIIYNVVEENLISYDSICLHSADYDLCHNVRAGKVNFFSVNKNALNVTGNNFSEVLSNNNVFVPYNMITIKKVFCGDTSDSIESFTSNSGITGSKLFEKYVSIVHENEVTDFDLKRGTDVFNLVIDFLGLSDNDKDLLTKRCELFYPIKQEINAIPSNLNNINLSYYKGYVRSIKDFDSCKILRYNGESNSSVDEELFQYGNSLRSGEFHVDRNLSVDEDYHLNSSSLFIRGL